VERVTTVTGLRTAVAALRADGGRVALVPTMGALHRGHLSLVTEARRHADHVVVSIFVNPAQFGPGEDLDAYPRDLDGDEAALRSLGGAAPDLVFAPSVDEVYPRGTPLTRVLVAGLTDTLCGARRPGHFDGVGLVVTKLHNLVRPDVVVYGRKDFQQLQVIRRIVADLDQPVEVVGAPLVREHDGLALSSRNRYLDDGHRTAARALSRALRAAVLHARTEGGAGRSPTPAGLREAAAGILTTASDVTLDYLEVVDPETLAPLDAPRGEAPADGTDGPTTHLVAVAAFVGPARLIDNVVVGDTADEDRLLAATAP
jgi:pantoate--beta-alanine ligase